MHNRKLFSEVLLDTMGACDSTGNKIWHGPKKHQDGIEQLLEYMESRGQKKGWLLTFCFLK